MLNFFIFIISFGLTIFLLAISIRFGMIGADIMDQRIINKSKHAFTGYDWYFRIPFSVGIVIEYFYAFVLRKDNYFKPNWWALKVASFISFLLFLALLQNRAGVSIYYSLALFYNKGWTAYFTSGSFVWSLNLITLMYLAMFVLIAIESIRMSGWFAPVRILYYSLFCFMMALLTIAVLYSIVALAILYLVITFVSYLLFKSRKRKRTEENEIGFFKESFSNFRTELIEWEKNRKNQPKTSKVKPKRKPVIRRKKRVTNSINEAETADDIPRLYPDD